MVTSYLITSVSLHIYSSQDKSCVPGSVLWIVISVLLSLHLAAYVPLLVLAVHRHNLSQTCVFITSLKVTWFGLTPLSVDNGMVEVTWRMRGDVENERWRGEWEVTWRMRGDVENERWRGEWEVTWRMRGDVENVRCHGEWEVSRRMRGDTKNERWHWEWEVTSRMRGEWEVTLRMRRDTENERWHGEWEVARRMRGGTENETWHGEWKVTWRMRRDVENERWHGEREVTWRMKESKPSVEFSLTLDFCYNGSWATTTWFLVQSWWCGRLLSTHCHCESLFEQTDYLWRQPIQLPGMKPCSATLCLALSCAVGIWWWLMSGSQH